MSEAGVGLEGSASGWLAGAGGRSKLLWHFRHRADGICVNGRNDSAIERDQMRRELDDHFFSGGIRDFLFNFR